MQRALKDLENGEPKTDDQKEFLKNVLKVFEGAIIYAKHLAEEAERAGNSELAGEEAMTDAYEYASIGCIEQNSARKHTVTQDQRYWFCLPF